MDVVAVTENPLFEVNHFGATNTVDLDFGGEAGEAVEDISLSKRRGDKGERDEWSKKGGRYLHNEDDGELVSEVRMNVVSLTRF